MVPKRYKYAVASTVKAQLGKIKNYKESSHENPDKLVTLISICIGTQVTVTGSSVGAATSITYGGIDTCKLADIDSSLKLHSIVKKSQPFTNIGKKRNKLTAGGRPPHFKYCLDEGSLTLPKEQPG